MRDPAQMDLVDLVDHMGSGGLPEWHVWNGKVVTEGLSGSLWGLPGFADFWEQRWTAEVRAFERILSEGDFLDDLLVDYFQIPEKYAYIYNNMTMRGWAEQQLETARKNSRLGIQ